MKAGSDRNIAVAGRSMTETADVVLNFAADQLLVRIKLLVGTAVVAQKANLVCLLVRATSQEPRIQVRCKLVTLALYEGVVAGCAYQLSPADRATEVIRQRYGTGIADGEIARVAA
jgi:hypothetical protein